MQISKRLSMAAALWMVLVPGIANACATVVAKEPTPAERTRRARVAIDQATAIIDGVVIRALQGNEPAIVRAERVLKGPEADTFKVGERTSCDLALMQEGERLRGPDVYFTNLDYSNARYEDRVLGSDRRKVWPYH